jgi:uncharacterized membrane protein
MSLTNVLSRLSFYVALALSTLLTIILLGALGNFGFSQVAAAGPVVMIVVATMLLNPVIFGVLGFIKATPKWRFGAAGAMLTLLLLYSLTAFGVFGPLPMMH